MNSTRLSIIVVSENCGGVERTARRRFWTRGDERRPSTIIDAVPRVISPVNRGGWESHTWDPRKSGTLFGFAVLGAGSRSALPLRFSVVFEYGGLIP